MGSLPNRSCNEEKKQIDPSGEQHLLALDLLAGNIASGKSPQGTTIANPTSQVLNINKKETPVKMFKNF